MSAKIFRLPVLATRPPPVDQFVLGAAAATAILVILSAAAAMMFWGRK